MVFFFQDSVRSVAAFQDDRKRKYHSTYETQAPTDAEMEAYRLTQIHSADPMAGYIAEKRRRGK